MEYQDKSIKINIQGMLDAIKGLIFLMDENGLVICANRMAASRLGYAQKEMEYMEILRMYPPESWKEASKFINDAINCSSTCYTIPLYTKSGKTIQVKTWVKHLSLEGKNTYLITHEEESDPAKEKKDELDEWRIWADQQTKGIVLLEPNMDTSGQLADMRILLSNSTFDKYFNVKNSKIAGKNFSEVFPNSDRKKLMLYKRTYTNGEPSYEALFSKAANRFLQMFSYSLHEKRIAVVFDDMTERKLMEKKLVENEKRLSLALDSANVGLYEWNVQTGEAYFSDSYYRMLGYEPEEFKASETAWREMVHPDDLETIRKISSASISDRKPYNIIFRIRHKTGSWLWVEGHASVIESDKQNKALKVLGININITEKMQRELKLKESQIRLNLATQGGNIGLWDWNIQTGEVILNEQWAAMLGYELEELEPISIETWRRLAHPQDLKKSDMMAEACFSGFRDFYECEVRMKHKNGSWVWILDRGRITERDLEGKPLRMIGTHIDINELKMISEELARRERILEAVALSVRELLESSNYIEAASKCFNWLGSVLDLDRVILYQNQPVEIDRLVGVKKTSWFSGKCSSDNQEVLYDVLSGEDIPAAFDALEKRDVYLEIVNEIRDSKTAEHLKKEKTKSLILLPLFIKDSFWGFVRFDECENDRYWKEAEFSALIAFAGSLERAIERRMMEEALEISRQTALRANLMKSQFMANMSHEIRTPMNGIIGFIDLLSSTTLTQEQQDYVEEVKSASDSLLYLINDVLDFSKIEAGKLHMEKVNFGIRDVVEDAVAILMPKVREKKLELRTQVRPEVPDFAEGDPARLKQVLVNLAGNAVKFTHNGKVNITVDLLEKTESTLCLRFNVEDTGIGIAAEDIDKLFNPFVQLDASSTRKFGGTGLGLAISNELVRMMDGEIHVESVPGKGSRFYFTACFGIPDSKALKGEDRKRLKGTKILLIDDNIENRQILRSALHEEECIVDEADATDKAIAMMLNNANNEKKYDVAIMDNNMPGMNGYELAAALKVIPFIKDTGLVVMTSVSPVKDSWPDKESGIQAYLAKPVRREELVDCLMVIRGLKPDGTKQGSDLPVRPSCTWKGIVKPAILLVEDNEMNCKLFVTLLRQRNLACDVAANGVEAIEAYKKKSYDMIFMDCQMPEMDGYQSTAAIRALDGDMRTPIIAMTANAMEGDREKCLLAGMDDYISKPINPGEVFRIIEKYSGMCENHGKKGSLIESSMKTFIAETGFTEEEAEPLFNEYLETLWEMLDSIDRGITEGNLNLIIKTAHQLKGSAGNLRITKVAELAVLLEKAAQKKEIKECRDLLAQIKDALE